MKSRLFSQSIVIYKKKIWEVVQLIVKLFYNCLQLVADQNEKEKKIEKIVIRSTSQINQGNMIQGIKAAVDRDEDLLERIIIATVNIFFYHKPICPYSFLQFFSINSGSDVVEIIDPPPAPIISSKPPPAPSISNKPPPAPIISKRTRSPSPIREGGAGDCLSISETNKLRAKLGLKPLETNSEPSNQEPRKTVDGLKMHKDEWGEFLHKPADNIAEKLQAEKLVFIVVSIVSNVYLTSRLFLG